MPTYEYVCENPACQATWEHDQPITDPAEKFCPWCGKETAKRVIAGCAFSLKGGRWGSTGYK